MRISLLLLQPRISLTYSELSRYHQFSDRSLDHNKLHGVHESNFLIHHPVRLENWKIRFFTHFPFDWISMRNKFFC